MIRELTDFVGAARAQAKWMALFDVDEDRVHHMIAYPVFQPETFLGVACIDVKSREILGVLVATLTGVPFSSDVVATDIFSHVKTGAPESTRASLLEAYEKWSRRVGAKKMIYVSSDGESAEGWTTIGTRRVKVLEEKSDGAR